MAETTPKLWSDFDGTGVEVVKKTNPRNWAKYPLAGIDGYTDFLSGVRSTGVEIAGVVSRRPHYILRRMATARSVQKLGYSEFFSDRAQLVHAGSEEAKGAFVFDQSRLAPVGMLEDKPHKLGAALLGAAREGWRTNEPAHSITIGVVSHDRSSEYIERLAQQARALSANDITVYEADPTYAPGIAIRSGALSLNVVQLDPYSYREGVGFGELLFESPEAA